MLELWARYMWEIFVSSEIINSFGAGMSGDASFYGDGAASMQTKVAINPQTVRPSLADVNIDEFYEISKSVEWLSSHTSITKVALQFPDDLLRDSVSIVTKLQSCLPHLTFFVLADTSYGSCCVDFVAAQHYNADVLIHYGSSCLSPTSNIPVWWVFGRAPLDVADCCQHLTDMTTGREKPLVLMFDVQYEYIIDEIFVKMRECCSDISKLVRSHLRTSASSEFENSTSEDNTSRLEVNGRSWCLLDAAHIMKDYDVVYIGTEGRTLTNLMMVMNTSQFHTYNPQTQACRLEDIRINKSLMKRFYLIEKARDANIVGIVVGTLAVRDYLVVHERLKKLIKKAGKKSYSIIVGKLNTAKLANFMEVDIFVLVSCPENSLVDSAEFYRPVVTPFEMELACNTDREWTGDYTTDFRSLLPGGDNFLPIPDTMQSQADVSLITGAMRHVGIREDVAVGGQVAVRETSNCLVASSAKSAGEYLSARTWTGLEQDLGKTPVQEVKQGQSGIAMGYENEPC